MLPLNTNIRLAYANGKDDEQNFIQNLSLFLCTFLKEHGQLIEKRLNLRETLMEVRCVYNRWSIVCCNQRDIKDVNSTPACRQDGGPWLCFFHKKEFRNDFTHSAAFSVSLLAVLPQALHYMLLVSEVEETEIFKICLEYWNHLAAELYRESPFSTSTSPLLSGNQHFDVPPRRQLYLPVLSKVLVSSAHMNTAICIIVAGCINAKCPFKRHLWCRTHSVTAESAGTVQQQVVMKLLPNELQLCY